MDEILCRTVFLRSFNVLVCLDSINFFTVYAISCVEYRIFSTIHGCISINIILSYLIMTMAIKGRKSNLRSAYLVGKDGIHLQYLESIAVVTIMPCLYTPVVKIRTA